MTNKVIESLGSVEAGAVVFNRVDVDFELNAKGKTVESSCSDEIAIVRFCGGAGLCTHACEAGNVVAEKANPDF